MATLKHRHIVTTPGGKRVNKSGSTYELKINNPLVGIGFSKLLQECDNNDYVDNFYLLAYIIEEYGDQLIEDLEDKKEDDLKEYVIDVEAQQAEPNRRQNEQEIRELMEDANAAELEAMKEQLEEVKEDSDIDDTRAHPAAVNHQGGSE